MSLDKIGRVAVRDVTVHYDKVRGNLGTVIRSALGKTDDQSETRAALADVNLALKDGDRLALLGLNGAGKSTLLKVIAGIFQPIEGEIVVNGSISPLFDVGLGMDGDLSGRQNLYVRGLFLGMNREQVKSIEGEIIAFTGLGDVIDMPVRTYSAGMYIRLAFAIATSVKPEILLMDEGLGAGDAWFRERAKSRLDEFISRAGVLILATHDRSLAEQYCKSCAVLDRGKVVFTGTIDEGFEVVSRLSGDNSA